MRGGRGGVRELPTRVARKQPAAGPGGPGSLYPCEITDERDPGGKTAERISALDEHTHKQRTIGRSTKTIRRADGLLK